MVHSLWIKRRDIFTDQPSIENRTRKTLGFGQKKSSGLTLFIAVTTSPNDGPIEMEANKGQSVRLL